jgi:general secretion pathway protein C
MPGVSYASRMTGEAQSRGLVQVLLGLGAALALGVGCGAPAVVQAPLATAEATDAPRVARKPQVAKEPDRLPPKRDDDDDGDPVEEVISSIREISPTEHVMSHRAVELFLQNQQALMPSLNVVPEVRNGVVKGIRLFGVRQDELLGRLGFENGDRLDTLMGKPVGTPSEALEAYAAMRGASRIDMEVERRGKPLKLVVRVE